MKPYSRFANREDPIITDSPEYRMALQTADAYWSGENGLVGDDLTTAYLAGFHKRDDEVAALKAKIERLRGLLRWWVDAGPDADWDDYEKRVREALGE